MVMAKTLCIVKGTNLTKKPNSTNHARVFGCKKTSKCPNLCQALHWNFSAGY